MQRITRHNFEKSLIKLNMNLSDMGRNVIDSVENAVEVIKYNDSKAAERIIENQGEIRDLARRVENRCIKLIMKEQPVATDLRVISSALKLVSDLEKIGRHCVDITEISFNVEELTIKKSLSEMADRAYDITVDAVNSYMNNDTDLIKKVFQADDKIDNLYEEIRNEIIGDIKNDSIEGEKAVNALMQAKYLEKIGDHAESMANWVNYSVTGEKVEE